jgi:hypothetical protein
MYMGIINTLRNVFREKDEGAMIQELIKENEKLRNLLSDAESQSIQNTPEWADHKGNPMSIEEHNKLIAAVVKGLIFWERAKGKVSAEYAMYRLGIAINSLGRNFFDDNLRIQIAQNADELDRMVQSEIAGSQQYDALLKEMKRRRGG